MALRHLDIIAFTKSFSREIASSYLPSFHSAETSASYILRLPYRLTRKNHCYQKMAFLVVNIFIFVGRDKEYHCQGRSSKITEHFRSREICLSRFNTGWTFWLVLRRVPSTSTGSS